MATCPSYYTMIIITVIHTGPKRQTLQQHNADSLATQTCTLPHHICSVLLIMLASPMSLGPTRLSLQQHNGNSVLQLHKPDKGVPPSIHKLPNTFMVLSC